ncbi:MAG: putative ABC transporter permease [Clostridiales bacterium]|nr:putative ABC transporter permease [Clostridiales bacterium]MDD7347362.1 putative ABC transporter permease [Clostridiales bacterium]
MNVQESVGFSAIQLMQLFAIYSVIGWLTDNIYCLIKDRHRFDRGIMRGPYMPLYGCMMVLSLFVAHQLLMDAFAYMLILLFFIATLVELTAGILIHLVTANRYWNYTGRFLNIHGYACLVHSLKITVFLAGCLLLVHPLVMSIISITPPWLDLIFLLIFYICFVADGIDAIDEGIFMRKFMKTEVKIYDRSKRKKRRA